MIATGRDRAVCIEQKFADSSESARGTREQMRKTSHCCDQPVHHTVQDPHQSGKRSCQKLEASEKRRQAGKENFQKYSVLQGVLKAEEEHIKSKVFYRAKPKRNLQTL